MDEKSRHPQTDGRVTLLEMVEHAIKHRKYPTGICTHYITVDGVEYRVAILSDPDTIEDVYSLFDRNGVELEPLSPKGLSNAS